MDCLAKKEVLLFLTIIFFTEVESIVEVEHLNFNSNFQYVNFSLSSGKNDEGYTIVNTTVFFVQDVLQMKNLLTIKLSKDNSSQAYNNEILKTTIDMCKLANGVVGTFALRWFMESFNEAANFKFECPSLKDKVYKITNYKFSETFLPLPKNIRGEVTSKYMGKISKRKGLVYLFTWRAYFMIK